MKIIFWGTPKYAAENLIHIVNSGYEVVAVVTQPDRKRNRGRKLTPSPVKQAAIIHGIPVLTTPSISKDKNLKNILSNINSDVYVVVAFGQILPKEILDQPKLGCWNSHASLLPAWRGAAPIQWSILNDDLRTGICIIAMEEDLDTGPVVAHESIEISDKDNLEILSNRLSKLSSQLIVKTLKLIKPTEGLDRTARLKKLKAIDQTKLKGNPTYARQIKKEDYLIDWNQKARVIIKKILGLYPNAYTIYKGKRIKILEARLLNDISESNDLIINNNIKIKKRFSGEIIMVNKKHGIMIMTNDFPIIIKYCQLEGKNKTDAYTLSLQADLKITNSLGN